MRLVGAVHRRIGGFEQRGFECIIARQILTISSRSFKITHKYKKDIKMSGVEREI